MAIKVVFYYTCAQWGFTETYYSAGSQARPVVDGLSNTLLKNFSEWRAPICRLVAVRGSVEGSPGQSYLRRLYGDYSGIKHTLLGLDQEPDVPSTDAVLAFTGATGKRRRIYLRGLSDRDVLLTTDGFANPSPRLWSAWLKMIRSISSAGLQIRYTDLTTGAGIPAPVKCLALRTVGGDPLKTLYQCTGQDLTNFPDGRRVVFKGIPTRQVPKWPRVAMIAGHNSVEDVGVIIPYALPGGKTIIPDRMTMQWYLVQYENIGQYDFERFSERKTGRPFGQLRGRSRAQVVHG